MNLFIIHMVHDHKHFNCITKLHKSFNCNIGHTIKSNYLLSCIAENLNIYFHSICMEIQGFQKIAWYYPYAFLQMYVLW